MNDQNEYATLGQLFTLILKKRKFNNKKYTRKRLVEQLIEKGLPINEATLGRWFKDRTSPLPINIPILRACADLLAFDIVERIALNRFLNNIAGSNKHLRGSSLLKSRRHFLCGEIGSFYGREHELERLNELLQNRKPVTISGLGGIGKTMTARKLIQDNIDDFVHGADYLQLFPNQTEKDLILHLAYKLGMSNLSVDAVYQNKSLILENLQIKTYGVDLLFLLDNVEHRDQVADVLKALSHITWIVTSRRDLLLFSRENCFRLDLPKEKNAVEMLFHYANQVENSDYRPWAIHIVNRLGRLPIFIMIAGAMVATGLVANLKELNDWLNEEGFQMISAGNWEGSKFLDALLDMIEYKDAQELFFLCGLFTKPKINLEIFKSITKDLNLRWQTINHLIGLSLINKTEKGDYLEMHPLIHEYAQERAKKESSYSKHKEAFNRQLSIFARESNRNFPVMQDEIDNILLAADSYYEAQDWDNLQLLWSPVTWFLWANSQYEEYIAYDKKFLVGVEAAETDEREQIATIWAEIGYSYMRLRDFSQAEIYFSKAENLYAQIYNPRGMIRLVRYQAILGIESEDWEKATRWSNETVEMMKDYIEEVGVKEDWVTITQAYVSNLRSDICIQQNDLPSAEKYARESIEFYAQRKKIRDNGTLPTYQLQLAFILLKQDLKSEEAFNLLQDIIKNGAKLGGEQVRIGEAHYHIGRVYHDRKEITLALKHLNMADDIFISRGLLEKHELVLQEIRKIN